MKSVREKEIQRVRKQGALPSQGGTYSVGLVNRILPRYSKTIVFVKHDGFHVRFLVIVCLAKCFGYWDWYIIEGRYGSMWKA